MKTNGQRWGVLLVLAGVALSLSLAVTGDTASAGLKDKLAEMRDKAKEKADEAKDKWKEREHPCADCGKPIHVGTRCATCDSKWLPEKAKQASEATKKTVDSAREDWQQRAHPCKGCGKTIHVGDYCSSCIADKARDIGATAIEHGREVTEKVKPIIEKARQTWRENSPEFRVACERVATRAREIKESLHVSAEKYGPLIEATVRDERTKEWVKEVVGTAVEVNLRMDMGRDEKTEKWAELLAKMPIVTSGGPTTLEEVASKHLLDRCPTLAGSDLVNRPSSVAVAFLTRDTEQMRDLKIVPTNGQYMSVNDLLRQATPLDLQQAGKAVDIAQSMDELENAIVSKGDVGSAAQRMFESINAMKDSGSGN